MGKISEVGNKRWKVDINARQEAILLLGSINLPGGAQRRRTLEDRLQMRQLFAENDVISCEIAMIKQHGGMSVQTRSMKYGKLENGQMIVVPPSLVKRVKRHFVTLRCGVEIVLGHNGYLWLTASSSSSSSSQKASGEEDEGNNNEEEEEVESETNVADVERSRIVHEMESYRKNHAKRVITIEERIRIARVANAIHLLADAMLLIMPRTIEIVYDCSLSIASRPIDMLVPDFGKKILQAAKERF